METFGDTTPIGEKPSDPLGLYGEEIIEQETEEPTVDEVAGLADDPDEIFAR